MHQGYYCLIQYRPIPEREEGLNVGVFVCIRHGMGMCIVRLVEDTTPPLERLGVSSEASWIDGEIQSLCRRLRCLAVEDLDEKGLRHFGACEAGRLVLLAPRSTAFESLEDEAQELFDRLVKPRFLRAKKRRSRVQGW